MKTKDKRLTTNEIANRLGIQSFTEQKDFSMKEIADCLDLQLPATQEKKFLAPEEASNYLGIHTQTLANWRCFGKPPAYIKIGGLVRYEQDALDALMDSKRVIPNS